VSRPGSALTCLVWRHRNPKTRSFHVLCLVSVASALTGTYPPSSPAANRRQASTFLTSPATQPGPLPPVQSRPGFRLFLRCPLSIHTWPPPLPRTLNLLRTTRIIARSRAFASTSCGATCIVLRAAFHVHCARRSCTHRHSCLQLSCRPYSLGRPLSGRLS
jgi:hypothetical protein